MYTRGMYAMYVCMYCPPGLLVSKQGSGVNAHASLEYTLLPALSRKNLRVRYPYRLLSGRRQNCCLENEHCKPEGYTYVYMTYV